MHQSNTMLGVWLLLLVACFDLCYGDGCSLRIERNQEALLDIHGNNLSVLCNASCFGPLSGEQIAWYNPRNERIPNTGRNSRVFSLTYNRGRSIRLFILNAQRSDRGTYSCAGIINDHSETDTININIIGRQSSETREVEYVYDGPRRGDVRVPEFNLPKRRPARNAPSRQRREAEVTTEMGSTPMNSDTSWTGISSTEDPNESTTNTMFTNLTLVTTSLQTNDVSTTPRTTMDEGDGNSSRGGVDITVDGSTTEDSSQMETTTSAASTAPVITDAPSKIPALGKSTTTTTTSTTTTTTTTTTPSSVPTTTINESDDGSENTKCPNATVEVKPHDPQAKTAFGRYGLLAFAITLSVAFLLLYTLILLHVILPRCCRNRRSVNFRSEVGKMESGPTAIDSVALKPLVVEPKSPDMGFTTVDLDDPKPEDKIDGQNGQNGQPVSPASPSEPQSPSKFVTTFTIGRKPSTSEGDAIFLHEGKPGETIPVVPEVKELGETTASEGKDEGKDKSSDERAVEADKQDADKEDADKEDADTSKDTTMDTSTDSGSS